MLRKNLRQSYKNTAKITQQTDKNAFNNTVNVLRDRYKVINKESAQWVPKTIHDENAIFSKKVPFKKPMRKPGQAAKISISIFDLESDYRPGVKRNQLSIRSSNLFTDNQRQDHWRSSSKKTDYTPMSQQKKSHKCFKTSIDHPAKNCSIDLSWNEDIQRTYSNKKHQRQRKSCENSRLFQQKKRTKLPNNYSSIQF